MSKRRREAADLGRRRVRHRRQAARTAVALLELERRPGHRLLDDGGVHGVTARWFVAARATRERLWRDVARHTDALDALDAVGRGRCRRRSAGPGRLLADADALLTGVRAALQELQALASACETARASTLDALTPVAERLAGARRTVVELHLGPDDPDAVAADELTARASVLERDVTGDPLAFSGVPGPAAVAVVADPVRALCARLGALTRLRDGWDAVGTGLDRDLAGLAERRARVVRARARAGAELRDAVPARPPARAAELRGLREAVTAAEGWRARHDAVVALRECLARAHRELDTTAALVDGLLERRDDLRGRFGAYRARTRRLGCADDPELDELARRIATRLWAVPSELARATRDLAAYRRRLGRGERAMNERGFTVEIDRNPWLAPDATRVDAIVTVTGPRRPPADADLLQVVVVDCSGSMLGDKIEQARTATRSALATLPDGTLFAVVAGTSRARAVYPERGTARADGRTRAAAVAAVRSLRAGGGTRFGVWLDAVRAVAEDHPGTVRHALMLTDGRNAEPEAELRATLDRCVGTFTCDCRGIGTDWEVGELREIATALHGDVDIVADAVDLPADLARVLDAASRRSVPGVVLRLWTPAQAWVRALTQVAPEVRKLAPRAAGPGVVEVPLGDWGAHTREYHLRVDVPPRPAGDRMIAARVAAGPRGHPDVAGTAAVVVTRTEDPAPTVADPPRLAHYTDQVELAGAVREGLRARRGGDDATATLLLGRARELARRTGHHDTLSLLNGVVRDTGTGVELRPGAGPVEEMTLDARGQRSLPPGD